MPVGNFVYHVRSKSYVILLQKIGTLMCMTAVLMCVTAGSLYVIIIIIIIIIIS